MRDEIAIAVRPTLFPKELAAFYARNHICTVEESRERAARVLRRTDLIVAAWRGEEMAGIIRALYDGLTGYIVECCVDVTCQGHGRGAPAGSVVAGDSLGVGQAMMTAVVRELASLGARRVSVHVQRHTEEWFYRAVGFTRSATHQHFHFDCEPLSFHETMAA